MARRARGEGPNGFSFESSLINVAKDPAPHSFDGRFQAGNFVGRQMAKPSRRNVQLQRAVAHALDLFHMMPDGLEHAANLPVFSLDQCDLIPGIVALPNGANPGWRGLESAAALDLDKNACAQFGQSLGGGRPRTFPQE